MTDEIGHWTLKKINIVKMLTSQYFPAKDVTIDELANFDYRLVVVA